MPWSRKGIKAFFKKHKKWLIIAGIVLTLGIIAIIIMKRKSSKGLRGLGEISSAQERFIKRRMLGKSAMRALAEARAQNQKLEKQLQKQYKNEEKRWKKREKKALGRVDAEHGCGQVGL